MPPVTGNSPASPSGDHGGATDPNEQRLRQARAQQSSTSFQHSTHGPNIAAAAEPRHGGDEDPNATRQRLVQMHQMTSSSSSTAVSPGPNHSAVVQGGTQIRQVQPAQYGYSSQSIQGSPSPPVAYPTYQNSQSPLSTSSGQYFPAPKEYQHSAPSQAQQQPQNYQYGSPIQVGFSKPSNVSSTYNLRARRNILSRMSHHKVLMEPSILLYPRMDRIRHGR